MPVKVILITLLACCLLVSVGLGSWESPVQVFQPLVTGEGIFLSEVTYMLHWGTYWPSPAISRTCSENFIVTHRGPENRNIANRTGLTLSVVYNSEDQDGLYGDTLRVSLDTSKLTPDTSSAYAWASPDTVVAATIECILGNTKRDHRVRYLDLRILGAKYAPLGGVWDLDQVTTRPRRRLFH